MKHLLLLLSVLPFCQANAQLENGGFEELNSDTLPVYWKYLPDPVSISIDTTGGQDSIAFFGGRCLLNTTEVHSGQNAIEISNGYNFTTNTPYVGKLVASYDTVFFGGFPVNDAFITERPLALHFFAEYFPDEDDLAFVNVEVLNASYDVIGGSSLVFGGTVSTYTEFTLPILYTSSDEAAILHLSFQTATPNGTASLNTRLLVDDVTLENAPNGIAEAALGRSFSLYPNPVSDVLNLAAPPDAVLLAARITDALGRSSAHPISAETTLDCSGLADGVYRLTLRTNKGVVTKSFMVLR